MAYPSMIRDQAARKLGVLGIGQTLQSEISSDLDRAYLEIYHDLDAKNQAPWEVDGVVPDEYVPHLAALVADRRSVDYKPPVERLTLIKAEAAQAWGEIRELNGSDLTEVVHTDYF